MKRQTQHDETNRDHFPGSVRRGLRRFWTGPRQWTEPGGPGAPRRPPLPPVIQALDTNHDGVISADEIANAAQSLKTLLKSGSNQLPSRTCWDHRPRPAPSRPGQGQVRAGDRARGMAATRDATCESGPAGWTSAAGWTGWPPGQNGGQGGPGIITPLPTDDDADTNHDGILEADEIANAAQSLKKLDKNGEGKSLLTNYGPRPEPGRAAPMIRTALRRHHPPPA